MKYLETKRLILRNWQLDDARDLFEYANNPKIGPMAGWKPHENIEESIEIVKMFIKTKQFAITIKPHDVVIGSIGWQIIDDKTVELGYVLSEKYWGQGIMPEAIKEVIKYLFDELNYEVIISGHFDFNQQSKRVIEKLNFKYFNTSDYIRKFDNAQLIKLNYKLTKGAFSML